MLLPVRYLKPDIIIDNYAGKKEKNPHNKCGGLFLGIKRRMIYEI